MISKYGVSNGATSIPEDPTRPFLTVVKIGEKTFGKGAYLNKKQSKQMAAEETLNMISPGLFPTKPKEKTPPPEKAPVCLITTCLRDTLTSFFLPFQDPYSVAVEDQKVLLVSGSKTPAQVLQEYCNRSQYQHPPRSLFLKTCPSKDECKFGGQGTRA